MSEQQSSGDVQGVGPEAWGRIAGHSRHGDLTLDQLVELQPGLGRLMPEISDHYWLLYYAGTGGNWRLAQHCVGQIRSRFRIGTITRPQMKPLLEEFQQQYLGPIEAAVRAGNREAFEQAFQAGIQGLNAKHAEAGHPEIRWQLSSEPPKHLYLGPIE